MTKTATPDFDAITEQQKDTWATGDFNEIARQNVAIAEQLVQEAGPRPGESVLDVACGSGTAALVASRRYCEVTGIDYVPDLVERARARSRASGLPARYRLADAQQLPFDDASFDIVLSVFGVQFAPDQDKAARELARVCRSGGRIALAGPAPGTFAGDMFAAVGAYTSRLPGAQPPLRWGTDEGTEALLGEATSSVETHQRAGLAYWRSVDHAVELLTTYMGPIVGTLEQLDASEQEHLREDLYAVVRKHNTADDGTAIVENGYLVTLASKV